MLKKVIAYSIMSLLAITGINIQAEAKGGHAYGHYKHLKERVIVQPIRTIVRPVYLRPVYQRSYIRPVVYRAPLIVYRQPLLSFNPGNFLFYNYNTAELYAQNARLRGHRANLHKANNRWRVNIY